MPKWARTFASISFAIGGFLLTFVGALVGFRNVINLPWHLPDQAYSFLLYAGLICCLAAPIVLLISLAPLPERIEPIYKADLAAETELAELHRFCSSVLPISFAPLNVWQDRFHKNPGIFYILRKVRPGFRVTTETLVGSFSLIPLSKAGRDALDRQLITGLGIRANEIAAPGKPPAAIYLSWVLASGLRAKSHALTLLNEKLLALSSGGHLTLYATANSEDGLRLMKRYGFVPLDGSRTPRMKLVCKRDLPHGCLNRPLQHKTGAPPS